MREHDLQMSPFAAGRTAGRNFSRPWAHALVSEVFGRFVDRLRDAIHASVSGTNNLFDFSAHVSVSEIADFRAQREQWLERYETNLRLLFERRIAGDRRRGGRPDTLASLATVQLLDPFDQEVQVALIKTVNDLHAVTAPELAALNPRIALLLNEDRGDVFDNPFGPPYVLDAIGSAARSVYRTSHVWRALMDRVVSDITPVFLKMYIAESRFLADQNVLPDIKARLRVQIPHFPSDERDLFQTFSRLLTGAAPVPSVPSPALHVVGHPAPALRATFTGGGPARPANSSRMQIPFGISQTVPLRLPDQEIRFALSKLARLDAESGASVPESAGPRFALAPRPVATNLFESEAPAAQGASEDTDRHARPPAGDGSALGDRPRRTADRGAQARCRARAFEPRALRPRRRRRPDRELEPCGRNGSGRACVRSHLPRSVHTGHAPSALRTPAAADTQGRDHRSAAVLVP
jgi:hypothetical protein